MVDRAYECESGYGECENSRVDIIPDYFFFLSFLFATVPKPSFVRDVLGITAGYGLLTLEGVDHQAQRRFMNQAFAFKYLHERECTLS